MRGGAAEPPRVACGACPPPPCHSCPSLGVRGERRARDGGVARELKEHIVRERREQRDVRRVGGARELDVPALHHDAFAHVDEDLLLVRAALRDDGGDGVDLLEIVAGLALHRELQRGHTAALACLHFRRRQQTAGEAVAGRSSELGTQCENAATRAAGASAGCDGERSAR